MSNYTQITFFAPKDALLSGNPAKLIKGAEVDPELAAIATAIASKYDATNFAFANPSATIGLTAVNGTSSNPMRSDAAPALSQAISPTWTGNHLFAPSSGVALTINGNGVSSPLSVSAGALAQIANFDTTNTNGGYVRISKSGVAAGYVGTGGAALGPGTSADLVVRADGGLFLTSGGASARIQASTNGNVTVNAPTSGVALATFLSGAGDIFTARNSGSGVQASLGTATGFAYLDGSNGGLFLSTQGSANPRLSINTAGNVTVNAPSSGQAITAFGAAGGYAASFNGSGTTSQSNGVAINAGTNSADISFFVKNTAASATYLQVRGDGLVQAMDQGGTLQDVGWRGTPLNGPGTNYTPTVADRGKTINATSGTTITMPNGFAAGDVVSIIISSGSCTIAQGAGLTLLWAGNGATTGNRTLTGAGIATVMYQASNQALISGAGLS